MSSDQGHPSGSERSPLLPKRNIEHHEIRVQEEDQEVSVRPEKSQAMVMYVSSPYDYRNGVDRMS